MINNLITKRDRKRKNAIKKRIEKKFQRKQWLICLNLEVNRKVQPACWFLFRTFSLTSSEENSSILMCFGEDFFLYLHWLIRRLWRCKRPKEKWFNRRVEMNGREERIQGLLCGSLVIYWVSYLHNPFNRCFLHYVEDRR